MSAALDQILARISVASKARIGPETVLSGPKGNEIIEVSPSVLSAAAGLTDEEYALARAVASEGGNEPAPVQLAIAEIIRNRAKHTGKTISKLVLYDPNPGQTGYFGRQAGGRYVATTLDPTERSLAAARIALEGSTDIAGGAMRFFAPKLQDRGVQAGIKLKKDAIDVVKSWAQSGYRWVKGAPLYHYGIAPYTFTILAIPKMASAGLSSVQEAIQMIQRGRAGLPPKIKAPMV